MINKAMVVFTTVKPIGATIIAMLAIFAPVKPMIIATLVLVLLDTITGIIASFRESKVPFRLFSHKSWKHITSSKLGNTISKALTYVILIIGGFMIDTYLVPNTTLYITKGFAGAIAIREIKSLLENAERILGGGIIVFFKNVIKHGFKNSLDMMFKDKSDDNKPTN